MQGFNPGAGFVQGVQAGQQSDLQQRQMSMQEEANRRASQIHGQTMDMNDMKMSQMNNQLEAQNRLIKDSKKRSMYQSMSIAFSDNNRDTSQTALDELNLDTPDTPVRLFDSSDSMQIDAGLKYLETKGMVREPYIIDTDEEGKQTYRAPNKLDPNEVREATNNTRRDSMEMLTKMSDSGMLLMDHKGTISGFDDVAAVSGMFKQMPQAQKNFDSIVAGWATTKAGTSFLDETPKATLREQYRGLEDQIAQLKKDGKEVPEAMYDSLYETKTAYLKSEVGDTAAKDYAKRIQEKKRARLEPAYEGEAEDITHYNSVQLKDKDKRFEEVQTEVQSFRVFKDTKARLTELVDKSGIDRDAVSNIGFKIKQHLGDDTPDVLNDIISGGSNEQAAFDRIETAIGYPMVQLIKDISGAAVTNEEREYLMNLVVGGEFKNMDALTEKMDEFVNTLGKNAKRALNKEISGGKALRPKWGAAAEKEINSAMTSGKPGSTIPKKVTPKQKKQIDQVKTTPVSEATRGVVGTISDKIFGSAVAKAKEAVAEYPIGSDYKGQKVVNRNPSTGELKLADGTIVKVGE